MPMTISWESTYKEFNSAQWANRMANPRRTFGQFFPLILCTLGALISVAIFFLDLATGKTMSDTALISTFAFVGGSAIGWISWKLKLLKYYENLWPAKCTNRTCTLTLSDEGIYSEMMGIGNSDIKWSAFCRFVETKKVILLYFSKTRWVNIPQSALTADQQTELMQLLETHIGRDQNSC